MKKILITLLVLFSVFSTSLTAQCKYYNKVPRTYRLLAEECDITFDVVTTLRYLVETVQTGAIISFAKGGDKYYFIFMYNRIFTGNFEILKNNSLDLILSNGERIQIYPYTNFTGKHTGITATFYINCVYPIDKQQLLKLSENDVDLVSLHYTSETMIQGSQVDKDGVYSLDSEIEKEKLKISAKILSKCILEK
jgi:hypothetical protein